MSWCQETTQIQKVLLFPGTLLLTWFHSLHVHNSSCLNIILSVKYSDETYKHIKLTQHYTRIKYRLSCTITFINIYLGIIFTFYCLLWLSNLTLLSGDIRQKPGPASGSSQSEENFSILANFQQTILAYYISISEVYYQKSI